MFFSGNIIFLWFYFAKMGGAFRLLAASVEMSCTLAQWSVLFSSNVNEKAESLESNAVLKVGSVW